MGQAWHAPAGAPRPAHRMGIGAICPAKKAPGWSCPCDTDAMAAHLKISAAVDPGGGAFKAGWHLTPKLADNIIGAAVSTIAASVENVWQFMRDNWL